MAQINPLRLLNTSYKSCQLGEGLGSAPTQEHLVNCKITLF